MDQKGLPANAPQDPSATTIAPDGTALAAAPGQGEPSQGGGATTPPVRSFRSALISTLTGTLLINILNVVSGLIAARMLGPTQRGQLAAILFFPQMFGQLGLLGIHRAVTFEISRRPKEHPLILASGLALGLAVAMPLAILGWIVVPIFLAEDKFELLSTVRLYSLVMIIWVVWAILQGSKQGAFQFRRFNQVRAIPFVVYVICMVVAIALHKVSPEAFAFCFLIGYSCGLAAGFLTSRKDLRGGRPQWLEMNQQMRRGLTYHLPQVLVILIDQTPLILLLQFLPDRDIGMYAVAAAIAIGQSGVGYSFAEVAFAKAAGEPDLESAKRSFLRQFHLAQWAMGGLTVIFLICIPVIITYAFGKAYTPAIATARWLIVAINLLGLSKVTDNALRAMGRPLSSAIANGVGLLILFIGGIIFVPAGGILAMGQIMLLMAASTLFVSLLIIKVLIRIPLWELFGFRPVVVRGLIEVLKFRRKGSGVELPIRSVK